MRINVKNIVKDYNISFILQLDAHIILIKNICGASFPQGRS